jgi:hypothetical protein
VGQNYHELQPLADGELAALFTQVKRNQMCNLLREPECYLPSHGQHTTLNGFFVSRRNVSTTYNYVAHEQRRVGTVGSGVLHLVCLQ